MSTRPPIPLGTIVEPYGKVAQVGWVGERYYWLIDEEGTIAMMPADVIEQDDLPNLGSTA